jgi:hypothetical protein
MGRSQRKGKWRRVGKTYGNGRNSCHSRAVRGEAGDGASGDAEEITAAKKKSEGIDAAKLGDLLQVNMLPSCYVATPQIRELRRMQRYRNLVEVPESVRQLLRLSRAALEMFEVKFAASSTGPAHGCLVTLTAFTTF